MLDWHLTTISLFITSLIALSYIDIKTGLLPDIITLPLLWLGLALSVFNMGLVDSKDAILGSICGYLVLWLVNYTYWLIRHTQGMGQGDFKLLAAIGAWLGWFPLTNILLFASLAGICVALLFKMLSNKPVPNSLPFGPFLAFGAICELTFI